MKGTWVNAWVMVAVAACVIGCQGCGTPGPCPEGLTSCDGVCVDTRTDRDHCGLCQTECGPDQVCTDSVCTGQCRPALSLCHGVCTDLATDADHCGACDNKCDDGFVCVDHVCRVACHGNLTRCGELCVDTENDPDHCGSCEVPCPAGYGCAEGECALSCPGTDCDGACVDTDLDPSHCGGCHHACPPGLVCSGGACALSCSGGTTRCGDLCVDTNLDPSHCGGCQQACPHGLVCSGGGCDLSCSGGTTRCGDLCVDTDFDHSHCGGCDAPCPSDQHCLGGVCTPCLPDRELCSGNCVSTDSNISHCGGCGQTCPYVSGASRVCSGGVCSAQCYSGYADCDGDGMSCEAYLSSDRNNCGACGTICPADQYCSYGQCRQCDAGLTLCTSTSDQCVNLSTNVNNCSACGVSCPSGPWSTTRYCQDGVCHIKCNAGRLDCDMDPSNGCEVYINYDRMNCGTCGIICGPNQTCTNGMCQDCPPGRTFCGISCVDLTSSTSHCGGCNQACVAYPPNSTVSCVASTCTLSCASGYLDCDGNSLNGCETARGPDNCGACGLSCSAPEFCAKPWFCALCQPVALGSTVPRTVTDTTIGQSDLFNSFCGYGNAPDVYYSFTAPAAGAYTFDTIGSSFDTVLEIRDGWCDGPRLSCDNNSGGANTSSLTVTLAQNQLVIIIVDGRSYSQGNYVLNIQQ